MADPPATAVLRWYQTLFPYRLDLIQEYAGDEHFIVDGDSLLRHVFADPRLDFSHGFQLLHAVYAVETFLANLKRRRCVFHVVFFDEHAAFAVPPGVADVNEKVAFAREAVRRHLERVLAGDGEGEMSVYSFRGIGDPKFKDYLEERRPYFVMCHDGEDIPLPEEEEEVETKKEEKEKEEWDESDEEGEKVEKEVGLKEVDVIEGSNEADIKSMVKRFMTMGYTVALINHVDFVDSKVSFLFQLLENFLLIMGDRSTRTSSRVIPRACRTRSSSPSFPQRRLSHRLHFPTPSARSARRSPLLRSQSCSRRTRTPHSRRFTFCTLHFWRIFPYNSVRIGAARRHSLLHQRRRVWAHF
jgi:hypothetical protein